MLVCYHGFCNRGLDVNNLQRSYLLRSVIKPESLVVQTTKISSEMEVALRYNCHCVFNCYSRQPFFLASCRSLQYFGGLFETIMDNFSAPGPFPDMWSGWAGRSGFSRWAGWSRLWTGLCNCFPYISICFTV